MPFEEVPAYTGSADVALVIFMDTCLSYHHVLPNKLLESLNAGTPVVYSNLPDMCSEVAPYNAGWVVENNADDLCALLSSLSFSQIRERQAGAEEWSECNSWSDVERVIISVYRDLLQRHSA